ncbi:MAG: hypothetical protein P8L83_01015 [Flavobacteriaceae bacterium]|nr:hypothetical protein [Flavobacteriaceae bacterium]
MRTKLLILIVLFSFSSGYAFNSTRFSNINIFEKTIQQVFYKDGTLYIDGFKGSGVITIYSIIGNKIFSAEVSDLNSNRELSVNLKTGNMFIIQIHSGNKVKTFKIIA